MRTRDTDKHADGTIESLKRVVNTIKEYVLPEMPPNELGQVTFVRAVFESVVAEVEASIARQETDKETDILVLADLAHNHDGRGFPADETMASKTDLTNLVAVNNEDNTPTLPTGWIPPFSADPESGGLWAVTGKQFEPCVYVTEESDRAECIAYALNAVYHPTKAAQVAAIRQRLGDIAAGAYQGEYCDVVYRFMEAVLFVFQTGIPFDARYVDAFPVTARSQLALEHFDSLAAWLWERGCRA